MAMWRMKDETKQEFNQLAKRYGGLNLELFADIVLSIVKERLKENPKIVFEISVDKSLAEQAKKKFQSVA
jgi:hypothetical protein